MAHALSKLDDPGESVDDKKSAPGGPCDEEAAVVRAKVECGVNRVCTPTGVQVSWLRRYCGSNSSWCGFGRNRRMRRGRRLDYGRVAIGRRELESAALRGCHSRFSGLHRRPPLQ